MKFDDNKTYTQKYYNKLVKKDTKTSFEEKYINLFNTKDISDIEKAFNDASYSEEFKEAELILVDKGIYIKFPFGKEEVLIDLNTKKSTLSIYNVKVKRLEYDEASIEIDVNYANSLYEIITLVLSKLEKLKEEYNNPERIEKKKNERFSLNKVKSNGTKQMTNDLILGIFYLVIIISFVLAVFFMKDEEANVFIFLLAILMVFYLGYLGYRCFMRFFKLRKFISKIKDDDELLTVTGKPSNIILENTDNKYGYSITYITITIDKVDFLAAFPEPVTVRKIDTNNLIVKLNDTTLTLNYYKNSKIINLKDSLLYEEVLKLKSSRLNDYLK